LLNGFLPGVQEYPVTVSASRGLPLGVVDPGLFVSKRGSTLNPAYETSRRRAACLLYGVHTCRDWMFCCLHSAAGIFWATVSGKPGFTIGIVDPGSFYVATILWQSDGEAVRSAMGFHPLNPSIRLRPASALFWPLPSPSTMPSHMTGSHGWSHA